MGENSEPKPESDVMLRKSLTIGLKKSGFEKSLSLGLKICRLKKSFNIGLESFGLKEVLVFVGKNAISAHLIIQMWEVVSASRIIPFLL